MYIYMYNIYICTLNTFGSLKHFKAPLNTLSTFNILPRSAFAFDGNVQNVCMW